MITNHKRFLITAALVCHLLIASTLVTSQVQGAPQAKATAAQGEPVTIRAQQQEKQGNIYKLRGDVEIDFRSYILKADEITYDDATSDIDASGHVLLEGGPHDTHLTATHATYNLESENGRFYDVVGSTGAKLRGRNIILTSSSPFSFTGRLVEKVGRDKFIVHHGRVTSCAMPNPKWTFRAEKVVVVAGEDAKIYQSAFFLGPVPIFYFPFADHPVERLARKSGFLLPSIGRSSIKGLTVSDSFYWAINRSMDATLGASLYSRRGWAQNAEFRARPSEDSFIDARYYGVVDRGISTVQTVPGPAGTSITLPAKQDQGGQDLRISAQGILPRNLRAVAEINYLSSFLFRAAFAETYTEAINSEVISKAFISDNFRGYSLRAIGSRYQNFQSVNPGDLITIVHAPSLEASSAQRRLGSSPFYWSFDAATEGLSRREPNFITADVVGRLDVFPRLSLPLLWHGWSLEPEIALRDTFYTERLIPAAELGTLGQPLAEPINRKALETSVELRPPALSRIFERPRFGHTFKHTIEPRIVYRFTTGVDNFSRILRFDARDVLSDTSEVEYALVNRIYAKRVSPQPCTPPAQACEEPAARELFSWEVAQKYFADTTFGGALVSGRRNVFTSTVDFTGIAFLTDPRLFSPVISRLRVRGPRTDSEWHLDYDIKKGRINSSMLFVNHRFWKDFSLGSGHAFLQTPGEVAVSTPLPSPLRFNQLRALLAYGHPNKLGLNAAVTFGFDANLNSLQYETVQTSYNWDCCGLTFEYRRFALGPVRNENQFRFALSLTNVGTFGNLRKQERLY